MNLYRKSVNHPVTTILIFLALAVFGIFSFFNTSISLYPDFDANVVMVYSAYPGASVSDVENNLTKLLENALTGVQNLKSLKSTSKENSSVVTLEFNPGVDIEAAVNNVRDKLDLINSSLPKGVTLPVIFKFSSEDIPIMVLSSTATSSLPSLKKILDDKVITSLSGIKGVGTVSLSGEPVREIQVYCNPQKLQAYGLTINKIANIISGENKDVHSGSIDTGNSTFRFKVENKIKDPNDLLQIIVASKGNNIVRLCDIATLKDGEPERSEMSFTNGLRAATIIIQKQAGANTVDVIKSIKNKLELIQPELPSDIKIETVWDSSNFIINSIKSLGETILITLLVVMLVVFLFLGRFRATFIIVLSIPIALLASLMYLYVSHNTLNIISMSALSLAIGMVVDDAIVVLENISIHIERGEKPKEAAVHATSEVGISVIASTLTMLCVFMPLTMINGVAGILFKQLGWIVSLIMIVSTIAAITLVPMLASRMIKKTTKQEGYFHRIVFRYIESALGLLIKVYDKLLVKALNNRKIVISGAIGIFVLSMVLILPRIKTEFFPKTDEGHLEVKVELPIDYSQDLTGATALNLYKDFIKELPEIKICSYEYGLKSTKNIFGNISGNGMNIVKYNINFGEVHKRSRGIDEISKVLSEVISNYPQVKKTIISRNNNLGSPNDLDVEIYGYSFDKTDKLALLIKQKMLATGIFSEANLSRDEYYPIYKMVFDKEKLAVNGISAISAANAFSSAVYGVDASLYREEGDEYGIKVCYSPDFRNSIEDIKNIIVYNFKGQAVKVGELGHIEEEMLPPSINRKNRQRIITIGAKLSNKRALSEATETVNKIIKEISIPNGVTVNLSGNYQEQKDVFGDLFAIIILITLLVYMVMASQFESFMSPFVIMLSLPFAQVGVIWGLWLTGTNLGVMAFLGLIILQGIVVKNGIVMIDYAILLRERGLDVMNAIIKASKGRLRPILMTTLTTVIGMLPMAIGIGEGSKIWKSLGITVCWGLSISTLITLFLIPVIYTSFLLKREKKKLKKQDV